jgi:hypothetical protein
MQVSKPPIPTELVLSVSFDPNTGVIAVTSALAAPIHHALALAVALTKDEARALASTLEEYAAKS